MSFSYFRTSVFGFEEAVQRAKEIFQKNSFKVLGPEKTDGEVYIFYIFKSEWVQKIIEVNSALMPFLPNYLIIFKNNGKVSVGISKSTLLANLSQSKEIHHLAQEIEKTFKSLVDEIAGAGELKPKEIILYTTTTCPYCKIEKAWLDNHKIDYKQVFVDLDQKAGEEMVRKTGQMGVPVTEIIYEDNEPDYVIGFDRVQLSQILGVKE